MIAKDIEAVQASQEINNNTYLLHEVLDLRPNAEAYELIRPDQGHGRYYLVAVGLRCGGCRASGHAAVWPRCDDAPMLTEVFDEEEPLVLRNHLEVCAHHEAFTAVDVCVAIAASHHVVELGTAIAGTGEQVEFANGFVDAQGDAVVRQGWEPLDPLHDSRLHGRRGHCSRHWDLVATAHVVMMLLKLPGGATGG